MFLVHRGLHPGWKACVLKRLFIPRVCFFSDVSMYLSTQEPAPARGNWLTAGLLWLLVTTACPFCNSAFNNFSFLCLEGENEPKLTCIILASKPAITSLEMDLTVISIKTFLDSNQKKKIRNSMLKTV